MHRNHGSHVRRGSDLLAAPFEPLKREIDLEAKLPKISNVMAFALALILAIGTYPSQANDWGKDGDFKLAVKTEPNSIWNFSKSEWKKQHFFEKSVRGYEFKLAKLPSRYEGKTRRDQLLALIVSVEAPHRQYDAVHSKAKVKPPALPSTLTIGRYCGGSKIHQRNIMPLAGIRSFLIP